MTNNDHYIMKCQQCDAIIEQCRCAAREKRIIDVHLCAKCIENGAAKRNNPRCECLIYPPDKNLYDGYREGKHPEMMVVGEVMASHGGDVLILQCPSCKTVRIQ